MYDRTKDSLLLAFQRRDSLVWKVRGAAPGVTEKPMPSLESTLPEIADYVAGEVYRVMTPYWEPIERFYYISGNLQFKLGADEVMAGNWDKATDFWQYAYDKGKGKGQNSFRASVNMMLYNEKLGNVLEALVWAKRASSAYKMSIYTPYDYEWLAFNAWHEALRFRLEEMEVLNRYLGGFVR